MLHSIWRMLYSRLKTLLFLGGARSGQARRVSARRGRVWRILMTIKDFPHPIHTGVYKCAFCGFTAKSQESIQRHEGAKHRKRIRKALEKLKEDEMGSRTTALGVLRHQHRA